MTYTLGFIMDQTLGHPTYHANLARWAEQDDSIRPIWMPVPYWRDDIWRKLPVIRKNWALRGGLRARGLIREALKQNQIDGLLFHTQVHSLCNLDRLKQLPCVLSLDATPIGLHEAGPGYELKPYRPGLLSPIKLKWNRAAYEWADALTTWSQWAKDSLVRDYGVLPDKVQIIPPGVDLNLYRPQPRVGDNHPMRILFVGAKFKRKGGDLLMNVFRSRLRGRCELDLVTPDKDVLPEDGVRVHRLTNNVDELRQLYATCDLFVLPTRGDCTPLAILEAMASGAPVVATDVGAIREEVDHNVTGLLIPHSDEKALGDAIEELLNDPARRRAMGLAGRARTEAHFNGPENYGKLISLMKRCVDARRLSRTTSRRVVAWQL